MALITLSEAELAWGDLPLLDHAEMTLDAGERVGVIGRNGSGKSSLLQCLAGVEKLDAGEMRVQDGLIKVYVEQEPFLPEAPTLREALVIRGRFEDMADERDKWTALARLDEYLHRLDIRHEQAPDKATYVTIHFEK
ncbi:MAG: ATP-binding cassette domain-containing protein, partial [Duodenibacillus sp.]